MELDPTSLADLTAFFAKRFPTPAERGTIKRAAGVQCSEAKDTRPDVAWGRLLTRAQELSATHRVADAAAALRPDDDNLQAAAAFLAGRPWPPRPASAWPVQQAAALAGLLAIAGGAWAMSTTRATARQDAPSVVASSVETNAPVDPAPVDEQPEVEPQDTVQQSLSNAEPPAETTPEPPAAADPQPVEAPQAAAPEPAPTPKVHPTPHKPAPATEVPGCRTDADTLVGYWYAGGTAPGAAGDVVTLSQAMNVRADYPDKHNHYNRRAPVRCALAEGARVRLKVDPVAVPGNAYWVPLYGADLID